MQSQTSDNMDKCIILGRERVFLQPIQPWMCHIMDVPHNLTFG